MTEPAEQWEVHQEPDRVRSRAVSASLVAIVLATVLGIFVAGVILRLRAPGLERRAAGHAPHKPPAPTLAAQLRALESYGWVDRDAGVAHIPIERAMDLVVQEGP